MNDPVIADIREFVETNIANVTENHEKIVSGWRSVDMNEENILNLYNLFKKCNKHELRIFEDVNFLVDEHKETVRLMTNKLTKREETKENLVEAVEEKITTIPEILITTEIEEGQIEQSFSEEQVDKCNPVIVIEEVGENSLSETSELTEQVEAEQQNQSFSEIEPNLPSPPETNTTTTKQKKKKKKKEKKVKGKEEIIGVEKEKCKEMTTEIEDTNRKERDDDEECEYCQSMNKEEKKINPFDNEKGVVEPLISNIPLPKDVDEEEENLLDALDSVSGNYINPESKSLKSNLQRLATDISAEEKNIRKRLESGEPANTENDVLADFISRANTVLKQTEAVTVRKIAEAETRKFLTSVNITSEPCFETLSNELMQDIWPKTNRWRSVARVKCGAEPEEEIVPQATKKKMDEKIDRVVQAAIKSAGESLDKRQIGKIRKAAVVYRDFDEKEERELNFRCEQTAKLVEYVSAYEATNQMDELTRLRLAIAFCTKRRDYFLRTRPLNFMQFSYMYIFLLEKLNTKTASICACLNYHSKNTNFEELEELVLNLFHEDYFLNDSFTS